MKESIYKSYEELPLFLNAELVAKTLGIAPSSAYELMHEASFPTLRVGSRIVVPKEKVLPVGRGADRRCKVTHTLSWQKPDPVKNYYPVPKVICQLGLSPGEIAVYSFLLFCEDRKTYQCYPSYRTIGNAVGMSLLHGVQICAVAGGKRVSSAQSEPPSR